MHSAMPKILDVSSDYMEYTDDENTIIVKKCLKFDCPLVFINNKEVLHQNMFSVFFSQVKSMPDHTTTYILIY